jgi:MFS family permease
MDLLKDNYFKRNAASVAMVEFFWGLGFPVILESTFLQIFLKNNGASDFLIGLVPSILIAGISIFPLISSYLTRNHEFKKKIVLYLHVVSSGSTLAFGVFLFFVKDETLILPAFFFSYVIFSLCIGLTIPVWLHFLVKIFSEKRNVQGLSIMYLSQNIAKVIASVFILKMVGSYSFSLYSAAWIFLCAGFSFLIGSLCFIFTKEVPSTENQPILKNSFFQHTKDTIVEMVRNKNFLKYLIGDLDNYVMLTVISFYANYATQYFGIKNATAAGLFVGFIYSGSILSNLLLGTLNFMSLKNKFLSTKVLSLVTLAVLIYYPTFSGFLLASLLMGFCRGTRGIIYSPSVKKFSKREDTTGYFAVAPLLTIVFGSGFPVLFGKMLDYFSYLGSTSYKIMFAICFCTIIITLIFGYFTDFNEEFKNTP